MRILQCKRKDLWFAAKGSTIHRRRKEFEGRSLLSVRRNGISRHLSDIVVIQALIYPLRGSPVHIVQLHRSLIDLLRFTDSLATVRPTLYDLQCRSQYLLRIAISRLAPRTDNWLASHLVPVLKCT